MNINVPIDKFDINNIFYSEKIKNTVMPDSYFIRIIYSNSLFTLNGVYLKCFFSILNISNHYNKYLCTLEPGKNNDILNLLQLIEKRILNKFIIPEKQPIYGLRDTISHNVIKIFSDLHPVDTTFFILKISGIWESKSEYGLTFKFIER
jgi:hypothetical protein